MARILVLAFLAGAFVATALAGESAYDPLAVAELDASPFIDLNVDDAARAREIPLRIYLPTSNQPAPVVLFSHGLGGSREGSAYLGKHWAARGYAAVFLQHPGSDESVWRDKPAALRLKALRDAAGAENFLLRNQDVPAVLNQLDQWNKSDEHQLAGRLDLERVGMSGHSFGAVTTQAVSGQSYLGGRTTFTDPRIKAAIAFSPSSPRSARTRFSGTDAQSGAFSKVKIPWLLMTGTNDAALIGGQTVESRQAVFPALPPGDKYELVLDKAQHSAFTERALPGDREARNPNHHRAILALSTAFWDAYLKGDPAARRWLDGDGPSTILEKADRWQKK